MITSKRVLTSVLLFSTIWFMLSCSPASKTKAPETIREFYAAYLQAVSKFPPDNAKIDALKQQYCTGDLLSKFENAELEADPFLNVQDFEEVWASNFDVASVDSDPNLFNVCVKISYDNSTHCVQVKVKEVGDVWKIDDILY